MVPVGHDVTAGSPKQVFGSRGARPSDEVRLKNPTGINPATGKSIEFAQLGFDRGRDGLALGLLIQTDHQGRLCTIH
ncbi:unannotated protein [freshwater metagenome]|uniref:Unannotated protein n=1 Tax=freshwater metagenome TaxID=449393 RepID=A0A6J6XB16_9ZZZZ